MYYFFSQKRYFSKSRRIIEFFEKRHNSSMKILRGKKRKMHVPSHNATFNIIKLFDVRKSVNFKK